MKMIFKNFAYVLKRFKTSSALNIAGLSTAFAVFIALITQVHFDLSFNRSFKDADDIYLLSMYSPFRDTHMWWLNTDMGDNVISKASAVESYTTVGTWKTIRFYSLDAAPETAVLEQFYEVRGDFESTFQPTVLEGNLAEAISEGNNIAISESVAKKVFGNESALGKTIVNYFNSKSTYTVKAILKDFPKNSTLNDAVFSYLKEDIATNGNYNVFMKIRPENFASFEEYLKTDEFWGEGTLQKMEEHPEQKAIASAVPFVDLHLKYPSIGQGDWNVTMALLAVAILTLAIAYINFVNFSLAMAPSRVKALTIQRVLGINKSVQMMLIALESAFFSLIAFLLALLIINFIDSSAIAELFSADLAIILDVNNLALGAVCAFIFGLVIGIYPARYITRFDVIESLKGTSTANTKSTSKLRTTLITFQFVAAITLIIVTISIKLQYDYIVNYSWGIEKTNIVYMDIRDTGINRKTFSEELLKNPQIIDYTESRFAPGKIEMGWGREFEGKFVSLQSWPVADNYLEFFGASVIAGSDFPVLGNPSKKKIIFNEEFLRKYDFTAQDVLGKEMFVFEDNAEVIGIVKDINFETLKMPIRPMVFVTLEEEHNNILFFKLSGSNIPEVIKQIESSWRKQTKEALNLRFLDQDLETLYRTENNLGKLVGLFSVITILIAMMGVYGLITFNIKYRKKEIAVRKINGATEMQVVELINRGMLIQLLIGFIIASPIAYWVVDRWLSNYAYRMDIQWWVFLLSGALVLFIALIAVSWQSYNAATTNPVNSLKSE